MIDCRDCRERLNDLLEDDFASNEASTRADLRAHLENCADCRRELEFLRAIRADLRSFGASRSARRFARSCALAVTERKAADRQKQSAAFLVALPRLALSGGAVLAACCLLLIVRSAQFQGTFSLPREQNAAPPTAENFAVPDSAFKETPAEKTERLGGVNAPKGATKKTEPPPSQRTGPSKSEDSQLASPPLVQVPTKRSEVDKEVKKPALSTEASRPAPKPETEAPTRLAKADKPTKPVTRTNEGASAGNGAMQ